MLDKNVKELSKNFSSKNLTTTVIEQVDELEVEDKNARQRLMIVSRNIKCYGEEDIKRAYEEANNIQIKLIFYVKKKNS